MSHLDRDQGDDDDAVSLKRQLGSPNGDGNVVPRTAVAERDSSGAEVDAMTRLTRSAQRDEL